MSDEKSKAQREQAARQREDYQRALEEELVGAKRSKKPAERIKAIETELARVKKAAPSGRSAPTGSTA